MAWPIISVLQGWSLCGRMNLKFAMNNLRKAHCLPRLITFTHLVPPYAYTCVHLVASHRVALNWVLMLIKIAL